MARPRNFDEALVVEQAMQLFWSTGYRGTTPQNLVDATGLSKSSLYGTFESKQGLFLAALDRYVDDQTQVMATELDKGDLRSALRRLYDGIIGMNLREDNGRSCLVCSSAVEVDPNDAVVLAKVAEGQRRLVDVVHARLVRAQAEGELAPDRDPLALARFVISSNMGIQVIARTNPDPVALGQIADEIVAAIA